MLPFSEIEEWQRFLKEQVFDYKLSPTEGRLFVAYFNSPYEEDFDKVRRKTIANKVLSKTSDPDNSAKGHLYKIYIKFNQKPNGEFWLWTEEDEKTKTSGTPADKDYQQKQKSKQLFDYLKRRFQRLQSSRSIELLDNSREKLHSLLMSMNYVDQKSLFDTRISEPERMSLFFLEISGIITQRWLVDRLIAKNDLLRSAYRIAVTADVSWKGDENAIWRSILDDSMNENIDDLVVDRLCAQVNERTVMLIVFGIDQLRRTDIEAILTGFWTKLQDSITKRFGDSSKRCLFLLVGEPDWVASKDIPAISLPAWTSVTSTHLRDWFEPEEVSTFCERESGKSRLKLYDELDFKPTGCSEPIDSPVNILDTICYQVLKTKGGLAELEQYWRIAS
jgi:hypothetical protein